MGASLGYAIVASRPPPRAQAGRRKAQMSGYAGTAACSPAPLESAADGRLPRLLKAVSPHEAMTLDEHHRVHGPLPTDDRRRRELEIIELVEEAGLRGRGGAGFPTAR